MLRIAPRIVAFAMAGLAIACAPAGQHATEVVTPEQPRPPSQPIQHQLDAEDLYKQERFAEAAWVFEQIVVGSRPADISLQRAEFWLAKSYYLLDDYDRSLALFRTIAGNPEHEYHDLTLAWLLELTHHRYDQAIEAMLWYPLEAAEHEAFDYVRDHFWLVYGTWYARHGQRELGERLLRLVSESSESYSQARVELAESMWRAGLQHEALPLYREVVERWNTERAAKRLRERKQPPPEHVELAMERLRSRGVPVGPKGQLD